MPLDDHLAQRLDLIAGIDPAGPVWDDPETQDLLRAFAEDPAPWIQPELEIRDLEIDGQHGPIPIRTYRASDADPPRSLLWVHGGGFSAGTLDWNEAHVVSAELAARSGAFVVSVDYRLALDGVRFPVPLDDVVSAWEWLIRRPDAGDGPRFLGGASAGAALALATAIDPRLETIGRARGLLLAYPFAHFPVPPLDDATAAEMRQLPPLLRFTPAGIEGMVRNYVGRISDLPPLALPGGAALDQAPPTWQVLSEYDDLRPSGELLHRQLEELGVKSTTYLATGMLHGHLNRTPSLQQVDASLDFFATALRSRLEQGAAGR